ncbi:glycoside hydrolase family 32 protein [Aspergillus affinis]|uniref:glycoside hydrolase family 32 protein n=1 Tax=Aspergillus affinis TaxID=1070780 RepID=UPI0022FF0B98|nr:glycoside hydrolase family 32 protein [Aspergillus affinis]KAI9045665.1 glycoside hydrolase family 32 protein [Aspergillus affinis]
MSTLIHYPQATGLHDSDAQITNQGPELKSGKDESPLSTSQWSPQFHLKAPHGWLNDPCGLGYDPSTGTYRVAFQWNPRGNDWGNVSWGYATSKDLVAWKAFPLPCLVPSTPYDQCGVFTGCLRATDIDGQDGALTSIYTSVSSLPIHYTLPYKRGCESLSLAVSRDGVHWERQSCNPILSGPPPDIDVTGWRDPYVGPWPSLQEAIGLPPSQLFGFISGGIKDETPTVFVYTVNRTDLRDWKYIGHLANVGNNFCPSRWSGDFGVNWEVTNLVSLSDDQGVTRDFLIAGTEGCLHFDDAAAQMNQTRAFEKRTPRQQLWMSVTTDQEAKRENSKPLAQYSFAGVFDHGCFYAANSFFDPMTSQHVVFGWVTEDDLPDHLRHAQGWSGMISLPRVLKMVTLDNVTKARHSALDSITSIETQPNETGSYTIRTLGIQPDPRLQKLHTKAFSAEVQGLKLHSPVPVSLQTSTWEIKAEFTVNKNCSSVGFAVAHSADAAAKTIVSWYPSTETFTITRPTPDDPQINHAPETAPHTLFTSKDTNGEDREEMLSIQAFFDGSVLEVFVNERTVITTRIYSLAKRCFGMAFFAGAESEGSDSSHDEPAAVLVRGMVWDGLAV